VFLFLTKKKTKIKTQSIVIIKIIFEKKNTSYMIKNINILSPNDQLEIRNLFSIDTPLLANINLSITNIGLYMTIAAFMAFYYSILATNHMKITPNK